MTTTPRDEALRLAREVIEGADGVSHADSARNAEILARALLEAERLLAEARELADPDKQCRADAPLRDVIMWLGKSAAMLPVANRYAQEARAERDSLRSELARMRGVYDTALAVRRATLDSSSDLAQRLDDLETALAAADSEVVE